MLEAALIGSDYWVLSGSLDGWGDPLIPLFTSVMFWKRLPRFGFSRLRQREAQRYGSRAIQPGGILYDHYREFLGWAASYDYGTMAGRSKPRHEAWLAKLSCPVIVVRGDTTPDALTRDTLTRIAG